jgi:hypothetical protein
MATQYDVKPGIFETISDVSIGTFVLNEWTHFELDGNYDFLLSDVVIKSGATIISASNYELAQDTAATTQEAGQSGKTLYGQIRITNIAYVGIELNVSGSNFGSYVSNQATVDGLAAGLLTKTEATGADIAEDELVRFVGTGQNIKSDNGASIALWDAGTLYNVAGTIVRRFGVTYTATGQASNQGVDPVDANNALYWYEADKEDDLKRFANRGTVCEGDMHTINDRSSGNYAVNLRLGKKSINGSDYEFHMIHLDGTVVTGNTTLENLLSGYAYIDKFAPDVVGTRTLIDMASRHIAPQSSGGDNDVLGGVLEDRFQGLQPNR